MIHVPSLQPDETVWGFLCRMRVLNDPQREGQQGPPLWPWVRKLRDKHQVESNIELVAKLTGTTLRDVKFRHTLAPFHGIMMPSRVWEDSRDCEWPLRLYDTLQGSAYFCWSCVCEDLEFWGFSYWRRRHQIPGVVWCHKHRRHLEYVEQHGGIGSLPHVLAPMTQMRIDIDASFHALTIPAIQRYGEICQAFLERERPFRAEQFVRCTQRRAEQLGVRMFAHGGLYGPLLSDLARTFTRGPWLRRFFPEISNQAQGEYVPALDRTITHVWGGCSAPAYALALTLLYESADAAMCDLTLTPTFARRDTDSARKQSGDDQESVTPELFDGVPKGTTSGVDAALRAFAAGAPMQIACRSMGVAPATLEAVLRSSIAERTNLEQ